MAKVNPYIHFNGNCEAAFNHYGAAFGVKPEFMRFKDAPPSENTPASDGILHVALPISKETMLMGGDYPESQGRATIGDNIMVSASTGTEEETRRIFDKLAEGGKVLMALEKTFWSDLFGMCTDKFGVNWMIGIEPKQTAQGY